MNANEMERYCEVIAKTLWDGARADDLCARAATLVEEVADSNFHWDNIRTQPFTEKVVARCEKTGDRSEEEGDRSEEEE